MTGSFSLTSGEDCCQADGDGKFDNFLNLPPPGADRFDGGEEITFHLTGTGITAIMFESNSASGGGQGTYCAAAHIQQTGTSQEDSDWLGAARCEDEPIPEPSSLLLFGAGLLILGAVTRRRRKIA